VLLRFADSRNAECPTGLKKGEKIRCVSSERVPLRIVLDAVVEREPDIVCEEEGVRVRLACIENLLNRPEVHGILDNLRVVWAVIVLRMHCAQDSMITAGARAQHKNRSVIC